MEIKVIEMDITKIGELADAIVNAANKYLEPGGGVCGAIFKAAGSGLEEECRLLGGCQTGEAKATKAYRLKNKYIIHTVGPRAWEENRAELLANCYRNCLKLADELGLESIAFPSISTGIYGYPLEEAAEVCASVICAYKPKNLKRSYMCLWNPNGNKSKIEYEIDVYNKAIAKQGGCHD